MNDLRDRELEIVSLVATGASNKEIAVRLNISANTVKVHLRNIFTKTGVSSRTELVMWAVNNGLVPNVGQLTDVFSSEPGEDEAIPSPASEAAETLVARRQAKTIRVLSLLIATLIFFIAVGVVWAVRERQLSPAPVETAGVSEVKWVELAPMTTPRSGLALVAYEDQLIALAGLTEQGVSGDVERYDPVTDRWKEGRSKPTPVTDVSAVVIDGKIYVPGGQITAGEVTAVCEVYDPALDEWSTCPNLPEPRSDYGLVNFDGSIYLFGGWDGRRVIDQVYRYRPGEEIWEELPHMPTARRDLGAAAAGRRILVIGGEDEAGLLPSNEIFLPDQSDNPQAAWSIGPPLPEAISGMGVTSVADIVYIVGGEGPQILKYPVMSFDDNRMWRVVDDFLGEIPVSPGLASLGKYIYLVGGMNEGKISGRTSRYQVIFTVSFPIIIQ